MQARLVLPAELKSGLVAETLLSTPGDNDSRDAIVTCITGWARWDYSKLIVVTNGSILLNLPLVNHEHRKLAGKLIEECGEPGHALFLESGPGGPLLKDSDDSGHQPPWAVWPLSAIIAHIVALGTILCFALFPIFGRPRTLSTPSQSDFARHVHALGKLMAETDEIEYAQRQLTHYQERVKRESGASHVDTDLPATK